MEWCSHCMKMVNTNKVIAGGTAESFCEECASFISSTPLRRIDLESDIMINGAAEEISKWAQEKGFVTPRSIDTENERDQMLGKLMLVVTELSEAAEAVRHNDLENFKEEIADTFIRLLDIAGSMGIHLENEIIKKMEKNKLRPEKHGKHCSL